MTIFLSSYSKFEVYRKGCTLFAEAHVSYFTPFSIAWHARNTYGAQRHPISLTNQSMISPLKYHVTKRTIGLKLSKIRQKSGIKNFQMALKFFQKSQGARWRLKRSAQSSSLQRTSMFGIWMKNKKIIPKSSPPPSWDVYISWGSGNLKSIWFSTQRWLNFSARNSPIFPPSFWPLFSRPWFSMVFGPILALGVWNDIFSSRTFQICQNFLSHKRLKRLTSVFEIFVANFWNFRANTPKHWVLGYQKNNFVKSHLFWSLKPNLIIFFYFSSTLGVAEAI